MRALIILLILSGAGYWWHSRRERFQELEALKTELRTVESIVADKQKQVVSMNAKLTPLREGQAALTAPDGAPEQLEKDVIALRDALTAGAALLDTAEDDYLAAVNEVREHAKGKTFATLKLPSGDEIRECRIKSFGEGFVRIDHSEGNVKVMADDLPDGWVDQFAVNYVSRHSKEENDAMSARVQEAILTPLDLKKAKLEEIDARIQQLNEQLMALSGSIREATRQADVMVRNAYRISLGDGPRGNNVASKREQMFSKAKEIESAREGVRAKYVAIRNEKLRLERQRLLVRRAPLNPAPTVPQ